METTLSCSFGRQAGGANLPQPVPSIPTPLVPPTFPTPELPSPEIVEPPLPGHFPLLGAAWPQLN